jgi:hypothetical protein
VPPAAERSRWWGLDRRQTILALLGAALVGALVVAVVNLGGSSGGDGAARPEVWVFGTQTVAAAPSLRGTRPVAGNAFGSVVGAPGRVWMYEAVTGQLGSYVSASSTIERLPRAPRGRTRASTALPLIAPVADNLWLAPSPGDLARYDLSRRRVTRAVTTDADATVSAVAASGDRVVIASQTPAGIAVHVVDPANGDVARSLTLPSVGGLHGLAADRDSIWVLGDAHLTRLTTATLRVATDVTLTPGDGAVGGAVAAFGDVYLLRGADQLVRVGPDGTAQVVSQLRGTGNWPPVRNAALAAGGRHVYALVPVGVTTDDESGRLLGYDARLGRATRALEFSSKFFAGGIAFSSK